ncbi:MAG: phosphate starvation-inducible PhoH-like protein, partial [Candidatus Azotimanducaceae bacterium]
MSPNDLPLDPTKPTKTATEARVEFPDNRILIDVCGEFDSNLATVEAALDVQIIRRGNTIVVMGEEASRDRTLEILNALYDRRTAGRDVEAGD